MQDFDAILIAGPTASGKSALALALAQRFNGEIVNADALQVYQNWKLLSARPNDGELAIAPHHLYGHVPLLSDYSVGHWLREIETLLPKLTAKGRMPIIVGGTGLYFDALLKGLADIPKISTQTKQSADEISENDGLQSFAQRLRDADPKTAQMIDLQNPARTRRAWEVLTETGVGLAQWQAQTPAGLLADKNICKIVLTSDVNWLNARISKRFDQMIAQGAILECEAVLQNKLWDPAHPSCRAIGAAELIASLKGEITQAQAIDQAIIATRRYAKRQRTWMRNRMKDWDMLPIDNENDVNMWINTL